MCVCVLSACIYSGCDLDSSIWCVNIEHVLLVPLSLTHSLCLAHILDFCVSFMFFVFLSVQLTYVGCVGLGPRPGGPSSTPASALAASSSSTRSGEHMQHTHISLSTACSTLYTVLVCNSVYNKHHISQPNNFRSLRHIISAFSLNHSFI